ncbi:ABC transporter permease [Fervidibacillus halotolerans]|uniref:ABC-2 family transporter protein n=1 Tax=Fervidibacillus halotolerans TaxID=2980027 RepID=A0A9E8M1Q4_9BACI|nr:ABC-2 family transporter protein [Fervidibacillus halotolerans]WAA12669.1 ABC-2 family transporter protein [Fervidibacillus halotolerans]
MKRYMTLYYHYVKLAFKSLFVYRMDFLIGSFGFILSTGALFFSLFILFNYVEEIGGWTYWEVVFLFAYTSLARAIWDTFMFNMMSLSTKVIDGSFDLYLTRPISALFQLLFEKIDPDTIGELLFSFFLTFVCLYKFEILFDVKMSLLFCGFLFSSVLAFSAIHLVVNALSFWIMETRTVNFIIWRLDELIQYPISIYPKWLQKILILIPFAFCGYFPVSLLINAEHSLYVYMTLIAGPVAFCVALLVWNQGMRKYQSTGS